MEYCLQYTHVIFTLRVCGFFCHRMQWMWGWFSRNITITDRRNKIWAQSPRKSAMFVFGVASLLSLWWPQYQLARWYGSLWYKLACSVLGQFFSPRFCGVIHFWWKSGPGRVLRKIIHQHVSFLCNGNHLPDSGPPDVALHEVVRDPWPSYTDCL